MSGISSISSNASMMSGMQRMHRPDPSKMAENLFSKLDTSGKGYLEKSDLQSAFSQLSSTGSSSSGTSSGASSSTSVDDVFKSLDSDNDGKITKGEMTSGLQKIADQLDSQFNKMREGGMQGAGGMPPPPPDGADGTSDSRFTQEELTSQLEEIGSSDSKRSTLISNIVNNFEKADSDGDGKVTAKEAMAYDQSSSTSSSSSSSGSASSTSNSTKIEAQIMKQIMALMHAYGESNSNSSANGLLNTLSTSA